MIASNMERFCFRLMMFVSQDDTVRGGAATTYRRGSRESLYVMLSNWAYITESNVLLFL